MALSPSPPPPAAAAASTEQQPSTDFASMPPQLPHPPTDFASMPPQLPPQLPHSPPDTTSTPTSTPTSQGSETLPLPANAQRWSVDDVHRWAVGQALLAPVADVLRQHAVDGHVLLNYVTNTILGEELGIAAFGTRVHILEAVEMLRWRLGKDKPSQEKDRSLSPASSAPLSDSRSRSASPGSEHAASSTSPGPGHGGKRSASRIADAEKKRLKRAEMKKNPALYAEYLQKERERNARRRERLRAERGRSNSGGTAADLGSYAKPYYTGIR
ncbi:hypothetical protein GGI08_005858 [Coemansia sp. S2]|nr:hypothetical protein H4S03_002692 [Coemansia sp. S3946]KAJ2048955.1 hypothetical protein GGI08_005858 [Coemansia sp. S2]KAJ2335710.1 hypothetical protein GGH92_007949 [Coemansia sp. RSA 2673]